MAKYNYEYNGCAVPNKHHNRAYDLKTNTKINSTSTNSLHYAIFLLLILWCKRVPYGPPSKIFIIGWRISIANQLQMREKKMTSFLAINWVRSTPGYRLSSVKFLFQLRNLSRGGKCWRKFWAQLFALTLQTSSLEPHISLDFIFHVFSSPFITLLYET